MKLFRTAAERELDGIIEDMKINLANNYKEPAHKARERLGQRAEELYAEGRLKAAAYRRYRGIYEEYTIRLKDYHH